MKHKRLHAQTKTKGFTIVELLVVIVVIAILASTTIVAFNGIQRRAQTAQATAVAEAYVKLIKMYKAEHGYYPSNSAPSAAPNYGLGCLGRPSDFPATGNYLAGECNINTNSSTSWAWRGVANTAVVNALAPYGNLPQASYTSIAGSSGSYAEEWRGVRYDTSSAVNPQNVFVQWSLKGNQIKNCGPAASSSNSSYNASIDITMCGLHLQ